MVNTALLGLVWCYTNETRKLRIAAFEQVEAMAKPLLTVLPKLRKQADALLGVNGTTAALEARGDGETNLVVKNVGNGVALNAAFHINDLNCPERQRRIDDVTLVYIAPGEEISLPAPMHASSIAGNCEVVFVFESISGRRYRSVITMDSHTLTHCRFGSA